jgi:hypothetical protein
MKILWKNSSQTSIRVFFPYGRQTVNERMRIELTVDALAKAADGPAQEKTRHAACRPGGWRGRIVDRG